MRAAQLVNTATGALAGSKAADPQLVSVEEAARYIGLSVWTLRSWAYSGRIASHKISTRLMFNKDDLQQIIHSSRRPAREDGS